jgi:hypothetical protein
MDPTVWLCLSHPMRIASMFAKDSDAKLLMEKDDVLLYSGR